MSFYPRELGTKSFFAGLWPGLPRRHGCGDDFVCCRDPPLHSPHGVHRKLHRLHALIHLASHIPPHAQTPHHVKGTITLMLNNISVLTRFWPLMTRLWHTFLSHFYDHLQYYSWLWCTTLLSSTWACSLASWECITQVGHSTGHSSWGHQSRDLPCPSKHVYDYFDIPYPLRVHSEGYTFSKLIYPYLVWSN